MTKRSTYSSRVLIFTIFVIFLILILLLVNKKHISYESLYFEARFDPLLSIAGTDTNELRSQLVELEKTIERLAGVQEDQRHAQYVRDALYPINFLYSLAYLEDARIRFLFTNEPGDGRAYELALSNAIKHGTESSRRFYEALEYMNQEYDGPETFYSLTGTISRDSLLRSASEVVKRFEEVKDIEDERQRCRRSRVECNLQISAHNFLENLKAESENAYILSGTNDLHEFFSLFSSMVGGISYEYALARPRIVMNESVCAREMDPPYVYSGRHLVSDAFFVPTNVEGPILGQFEEAGIRHAQVRPLSFYVCPEIQHDLGMIVALEETRELALNYPNIATHARGELLKEEEFIYESATRNYLYESLAELKETGDKDKLDKYEKTSLMLSGLSAEMEYLVQTISVVLNARIKNYEDGFQYDVSAPFLFLTHSAFPSLFLTHNVGTGTTQVQVAYEDRENMESFLSVHDSFDEIGNKEKLLEDIVTVRKLDLAF
ncbi:MAG: hypothetical protein COW88_02310 [Candidatus Lloydbacteria bacterium CG22_combo_CG10-13_8_21_14_all_47_15]|uniref:Uncharacterized protein n=1 Tax=Candidatus Lloydbacteria bacterium CG22_combo_CG10-13_8_21_14_all_47_15 TaxID=1974635 RepID=A0A2H0CTV8_9BACT|nr:MAG: hypothetical protein COW88_02310 [Candidatus Lloydbacteria bacterium CG22_combo_CG10-13_8_21_14_all_47_15]